MINDLYKQKKFAEIHNCYAVWIQEPKNIQHFRTGSSPCRKTFSEVKSPHGLRAYISTEISCEKEMKKIERACSKYLSEYPERYAKEADIFSKLFPSVIKEKMNNKEEKENTTNASLQEFFEQQTINFDESQKLNTLPETAQILCALADKGAKNIETPDGWKVQF